MQELQLHLHLSASRRSPTSMQALPLWDKTPTRWPHAWEFKSFVQVDYSRSAIHLQLFDDKSANRQESAR